MNNLMNASLTMTSKEIATLVEKRHYNVKRTIDTLVKNGVILKPQIGFSEEISNLGLPIQREVYVFNYERKRDTFIVVAQLSPEFTARLVDRWQELEAQQTKPMTLAELALVNAQALVALEKEQARLAAEQRQLIERQEATEQRLDQIETASDHFTVIGWWRYAQKNGSLSVADAAKMGRKAAIFCKQHEVPTGEVPDPRFGVVKTYPKWVLDDLFAQVA